ncbi:MAG TPA: 50S ribosomal protein L35 [Actinomycetota bacterium]|jgi:large subunit ribosomal protein L35|nr:50S ribosomal protein L35 [Actinomycetota bacterium]
MPKQKTHRGAAKRFRVTRTGKVLHRRANKAHLLQKKTSQRKRRLSGTNEVTAERKGILRMLGRR